MASGLPGAVLGSNQEHLVDEFVVVMDRDTVSLAEAVLMQSMKRRRLPLRFAALPG
jgi:hypothetical protein